MSQTAEGELVLVVTVASFTTKGFMGSASYHGRSIDLEFDDLEDGVFLTPEMCKGIHAKNGSKILLIVEAEDEPVASEETVAGVVPKPRISNARVYYEVGKEGGAILRIKKA